LKLTNRMSMVELVTEEEKQRRREKEKGRRSL
jgi:hypothetical protein